MIKTIIDLAQFLYAIAPLLFSLAVLILLCILLSKSIKRHATVYYIILSVPFFLVAIQFVGRLLGSESFNLVGIPFLGQILRDYIHMGTFGFPLLIIIMYVGALNPKTPGVKKLLNIRKELSIISGFPILTHSLIRVTNTFPASLRFFTNNTEYMASTKVVNELGAGISNFSFVWGIILLILFIPLWITSFDSIHKRMGNVRWKKLQKWSYVLYAALFIHAMGIQVGGLLNPRVRNEVRPAVVEATVVQGHADGRSHSATTGAVVSERQNGRSAGDVRQSTGKEQKGQNITSSESGGSRVQQEGTRNNRRPQSKSFADIKVNPITKGYIHIVSLILIFGSYLYLRLRKAKRDAKKKSRFAKI